MNSVSTNRTEMNLLDHIKQAQDLVDVGSMYMHYRDPATKYKVLFLSVLEALEEVAVVYQKQTENNASPSIIWVRPLSSWQEKVLIDSHLVPRFQKTDCASTNRIETSTNRTEIKLLDLIKQAQDVVEIGSVYTHYRNPYTRYKVLFLSVIEALEEVGVVYQKQTENNASPSIIWVRSLSSWQEKVLVDSDLVPRFQKTT